MPRFANAVVLFLGCSDAVEKSGTKCTVYPCSILIPKSVLESLQGWQSFKEELKRSGPQSWTRLNWLAKHGWPRIIPAVLVMSKGVHMHPANVSQDPMQRSVRRLHENHLAMFRRVGCCKILTSRCCFYIFPASVGKGLHIWICFCASVQSLHDGLSLRPSVRTCTVRSANNHKHTAWDVL